MYYQKTIKKIDYVYIINLKEKSKKKRRQIFDYLKYYFY